MLLGDLPEVHIHDLAPFEVLVVEVHDHELAAGHVGQELRLDDLRVLPVSLDEVLLLLLVLVLHLGHASLPDLAHDLLFFFVETF